MAHPTFQDITGQTFEYLLVLYRDTRQVTPARFWCQCVCGKILSILSVSLRKQHTKSCGCQKGTLLAQYNSTHGASHTPLFRIWASMLDRCTNPANKSYPYYGGRGITVCDRWKTSFSDFLHDMGERPSPQHSIDRKDNDGPYSLENCYWATKIEQARNMRTTLQLTHDGMTRPLQEWAEITGIAGETIRCRIEYYGWSVHDALTKPPSPFNKRTTVWITFQGETHTLAEWSEIVNIPLSALYARRKLKWTDEAILTTPLRQQNRS